MEAKKNTTSQWHHLAAVENCALFPLIAFPYAGL
jgi:hypothetical protein